MYLVQNLNSTWYYVGPLFFYVVKLYLENNKPEKIDENNNILKKLIKGVIMNEQKIYILV